MSTRSSRSSRRSLQPPEHVSDSEQVRAIYDQLRDAALVLDRLHEAAPEGNEGEAAWRARQAVRDALVCVFRLHQRCDAAARLSLLR
jgi:hypothetical protein